MIYKLRKSSILLSFILFLMFITLLTSFLSDQSRIYDLFIILGLPMAITITLCDEIGYFNKKVILSVLIVVLVLVWGLILYQPFSTSVEMRDYGLFGILTILLIGSALWMFRRWDKIQKAIESYDKLLEVNPEDITSLNNKGAELTDMKRYNWAIECFDKILELDPDDSAALHNKGVVITKLKKTRNATEKANEYFDRALKSDPGFENAKRSAKIILEN